jgi:hypothetical protein
MTTAKPAPSATAYGARFTSGSLPKVTIRWDVITFSMFTFFPSCPALLIDLRRICRGWCPLHLLCFGLLNVISA